MPTITVNGTGIFFSEAGNGSPCLVMHGGFGFDHSYLTPGLDMLQDRLRLIYYDHRCNGRSGRPPIDTLSFEQLADDADALRASLGHETVSVIAHSITGCAAGLEYALRHPSRLGDLILMCASPELDLADQALGERLAAKGITPAMADALARAGESDAALRHYFETAGPLYHHAYDDARFRRQIGRIVFSAAATVRGFELFATWRVLDRLSAISSPTLLIAGDDDPFSPPERSRALQAKIPGAELVVLEKCGHFPWVEQPEALAAAIRTWLSARRREARSRGRDRN